MTKTYKISQISTLEVDITEEQGEELKAQTGESTISEALEAVFINQRRQATKPEEKLVEVDANVEWAK